MTKINKSNDVQLEPANLTLEIAFNGIHVYEYESVNCETHTLSHFMVPRMLSHQCNPCHQPHCSIPYKGKG